MPIRSSVARYSSAAMAANISENTGARVNRRIAQHTGSPAASDHHNCALVAFLAAFRR